MRIIHTGDWHLNHRLGRETLAADLEKAVAQIACHCEAEQADVLLIAGDLFCGRESREQIQTTLQFLKKTFAPFLEGGGTVVALSGNHDSEAFFLTLRDAFDLVAPIKENADGVHAGGRFYIAPNARILKLRGRSRQMVQFVLMPYPTPRSYEQSGYRTRAEKNAGMAAVYHNTLEIMKSRVDERYPAVLVSHVSVRGVATSDLFTADDEDDVLIDPACLPTHFAYGAFGHIHRSGPVVPGSSHFRYCGSLLPLNAGEAGQAKSALLIDIGQAGRMGEPKTLLLTGPRLLDIVIEAGDIGVLRERYPDCDTAFVKYRLRYEAAKHPDPFPLHEQIRDVFPHWYDSSDDPRREDTKGDGKNEPEQTGLDLKNVVGNVRDYLCGQAQFEDADAPQDDVCRLAELLLGNDALMQALQNPEKKTEDLPRDGVLMAAIGEVRL